MLTSWVLLAFLAALDLALLPYFVFLMTISLASIFARRQKRGASQPQSRLAIVIPAHNEETGIAETVHSCLAADYPSSLFTVIVIADNCTDDTADIAANAGATVYERFDETKKSKGYALEHLLGILSETGKLDSLDAVVIVDADTTIDPDLLLEFDRELSSGTDWLQCYYTVSDPDRTRRTRLLTYGFSLFNGVTLLGQNGIGLSAAFRGNGMCFSVRGLARRPWKSHGLVEDMDYSWSIRIAGERIKFLADCRVYGAMPGDFRSAAAMQRRRWEFGRLETRNKFVWPLLRSRYLGIGEKIASFLELTLPSLGRLVVLYLLATILNASALGSPAIGELGSAAWWFVAASLFLMTASLCVHAISPFIALNLPWKFATSVLFFPAYLVWKLFVVFQGRPREWVRTEREPRVSQSA